MRFRREQYIDIMTFGEAERPMFVELFGPLVGLEQEWAAQGATQEEIDLVAFDWDYVPVVNCGGNTGQRGGLEPTVLEDTPAYTITRDSLGRTTKLIKEAATIALPLDFPVRDMESWLAVKPLFTFHEDRIDWQQVEQAKREQAEGALVVGHIPGGFDLPRELMGDEAACLAYYEQPDLMRDILGTALDTSLNVFERITDVLTIDQLSVHEDLAGKSGPLIGPRQVRKFIQPYFKPIWELLSARGTRIFDMDSDGNVASILDELLACGLTNFHPVEPAAGMDPVQLRQKYGSRLAMKGGIDKHVLRQDKDAIRAELEYKLQPQMRAGGMVFGLDHRITNGTSIDNYRYYVDTGREILGLPPRDGKSKGWRRMAF